MIYKIIGLDFTSGERVFAKKLLIDHLSTIARLPRFGLETFINEHVIKRKLRVKIVKWKNVSHARKSEKTGFFKGRWADFRMFLDILKVVSFKKLMHQNYKIRALSRRT